MSKDGIAHISHRHHFGGFVLAGGAAFCVDALGLVLLTDVVGVSPYVARLFSILLAMVVSWQINRRVTFGVASPATFSEFRRFAAVSWIAQAVNYAAFTGILLMRPDVWPVAALAAASLFAMFVSYAGFRFGVFHKH
jgi:putative flippase GtrA